MRHSAHFLTWLVRPDAVIAHGLTPGRCRQVIAQ
jgi:hypothetical protein